MSDIVEAKTYSLSPQETALLCGDLSKLSEAQRAELVMKVCDSIGLNPLTRPFQYIELNRKLVLYATKDCTEQLRKLHAVSLTIVSREQIGDAYVVTAQAKMPSGRVDESTGAVSIKGLGGDNLANAMMKTETKAKRRVTLSICGLGLLDESEIDTIPGARVLPPVSLLDVVKPVALQATTATGHPHYAEGYALGKQLGKLAGAVNLDLQRLGGDVLALKAEYENALSQKNPRVGHSEPTTVAVAAPVAITEPTNAPAVDGEAGTYPTLTAEEESLLVEQINGSYSINPQPKEAPASEKTQAVMAVMTHAGFEREFPAYADKMQFCSSILRREITAWSQLSPQDCAQVQMALDVRNGGLLGEVLATDSEIVQLQIHLKDADFVAMLKKSRTYREAQEAEQTQADSLRAARLAYAGSILKHPVASFKELTSVEIQTLFAELKK